MTTTTDSTTEPVAEIADELTAITTDAVADAILRFGFVLGIDIARIQVNPATQAFVVFVRDGDAIEIPARPPPEEVSP